METYFCFLWGNNWVCDADQNSESTHFFYGVETDKDLTDEGADVMPQCGHVVVVNGCMSYVEVTRSANMLLFNSASAADFKTTYCDTF